MNLVEDELIEEIEQLDEGWWSGVGSDGAKSGLFPGGSGNEFQQLVSYSSHQPTTSN